MNQQSQALIVATIVAVTAGLVLFLLLADRADQGTLPFQQDQVQQPTIVQRATPTPAVSSLLPRFRLEGRGQQATDLFQLREGLARFRMEHAGRNNFAIWLFDSNGVRLDLMVNVIGPFTGSRAVNIPRTGDYLLDIDADGDWRVTVEQ